MTPPQDGRDHVVCVACFLLMIVDARDVASLSSHILGDCLAMGN